MRRLLILLMLVLSIPAWAAQTVVRFDAYVGPGDHELGSLSIDAATFVTTIDPEWGSWSGFAFSAVSNTIEATWVNQYAAAQARSSAYAVAYHDSWNPAPEIRFVNPVAPAPCGSTTPPGRPASCATATPTALAAPSPTAISSS